MKMEKTDLIDWQKRYGTEEACAAATLAGGVRVPALRP